jgi:hypothetical protein
MTAKELIDQLQQILRARDGEDVEVVISTNLQRYHDIIDVIPTFDVSDGTPDLVNLMSLGAMQEVELNRIGLFVDEDASKLN